MSKKTKILIWVLSSVLAFLAIATGLFWAKSVGLLFAEPTKEEIKADVGWYSEEETEFVITTVEELLDVAKLSKYYNFEGQTIKLGADIIFNEGNAEDWKKDRPDRKWYHPIEGFAGTFDGQGHTISGLYGSSADAPMGIFSATQPKALIKNFRIINSYFKVSGDCLGGVSASGTGTFDSIYSDVILLTDFKYSGGIIGKIDSGKKNSTIGSKTTISNCWFAGELHMSGHHGAMGGGIAGYVSAGVVNISHCLSSAKISTEATGVGAHTGGILGDMQGTEGSISVHISDTLNVSHITADEVSTCVGSVLGRVRKGMTVTLSDVYTTHESYSGAIVMNGGTVNNGVLPIAEKALVGYGGYQWTTLDFENYWAIDMEGTPILKTFSNADPSLEGIEKNFNTAWYDKNAKELIIKDGKDFLGLQYLATGQGMNFQGQTIKLAADIKVNDGKAATWRENAPDYEWTSIGTWANQFSGVFDGQGHTISGIYLKTSTIYTGLFGVTASGSSVRNLKIVNSYYENDSGATAVMGSVVGRCMGNLENIYSEAILVSNAQMVGGLIGQIWTSPMTISNCWFNGNISMEDDYGFFVGGIAGEHRGNTATIEHCLYTGHISVETPVETRKGLPNAGGMVGKTTNKDAVLVIKDSFSAGTINNINNLGCVGSVLGRSQYGKVVLEDVYATKECYEKMSIGTITAENLEGAVYVFSEAMLTGNGGYEWTTLDFKNYWSIVTNDTPTLKAFAKTSPSTAGLTKKLDFSWYDSSKDVYILDSMADLLAFQLMGAGNTFKGKTIKLGADITVNSGDAATWGTNAPDYEWTSVGTWAIKFSGIFDGQGHTISGIYQKTDIYYTGLFGVTAEGSMVKNLKLTNSYFENTSGKGAVMGSIVGRCMGDVDSVYSDAILVSNAQIVGGIIGQVWQVTANITNCWFDGSLTMTGNKGTLGGGILGEHRQGDAYISHCLNTGSISVEATKNPFVGGICGEVTNKDSKLYISDCLNVGAITYTGKDTEVGSILGYGNANTSVIIENTYATTESYGKVMNVNSNCTLTGSAVQKSRAQILGEKGYTYTLLDFEKYWVAVSDSTPELKWFTEKTPLDVRNVAKMDIGWYEATENKTFVIRNRNQFLGFLELAQTHNFKTQTIELATDIVMNEGDAATWKNHAPEEMWTSIGTWKNQFAGTFDGKGHTISGVYQKTDIYYVGLFGVTAESSVIKNLKLTNSYFENTSGEMAGMGSIVGRCLGDVHSVYSNAILVSNAKFTGGIIGQIWTSPVRVTNCWFDGSITLTGTNGTSGGGIAGEQRAGTSIIAHCLNTGSISVSATKNPYVGGICGQVTNANSKLVISDCLNVGTITNLGGDAEVGSILGYGHKNTGVTIENTYATAESYATATVVNSACTLTGAVGQKAEAKLLGTKGYANTLLDFETYWAAVAEGTPELRTFTNATPLDVSNVTRVDISWYDTTPNKTFVIQNMGQFLGFLELAQTYNFKSQTIELGIDVVMNEGSAAAWKNEAPENVWTSIGTWKNQFAGTFDGKGHTISGIYQKTNINYTGLFGVTAVGSVVKNLKLINSYFENTNNTKSGAMMGSIVGRCLGDVDSIYSNAILVSSASNVGGIIGQIWTSPVKVTNCWFDGSLTLTGTYGTGGGGIAGEQRAGTSVIAHCLNTGSISVAATSNPYVGGICGHVTNVGSNLSISDCLNVGVITYLGGDSEVGSILGWGHASTTVTITKTYATTESYTAVVAVDSSCSVTNTAKQFAKAALTGVKGYTATLLDFKNYWIAVENGTPELKNFTTKTPLDLTDYAQVDISWYDKTENKTFVLETKDQFYGFIELAKTNTFATQTIELGIDISMNRGNASDWKETAPINVWIPIGTWSTKFSGTFDGKGHTISGLYHKTNANNAMTGMFGVTAAGSSVKNFKLINSYFENTSGNGAIMGSVIGRCMGNIDCVYSDAILVSNSQIVGGIIGQIWDAGAKIQVLNCWFDGTVTLSGSKGFRGAGIVGEQRNGTAEIKHCLNAGTISTTCTSNPYIGGICGQLTNNGATLTISDSLNVGNIIYTSTDTEVGSILGFANDSTNLTIENTYAMKESYSVAVNVGTGCIVSGNAEQKERKDLIGTTAQTATKLDFDNYWAVIPNSTPVLKTFSE